MARPSNTLERREQIAQALIRVLAKKGYDGATIADIASEAELTPGLVHYHFKTKLEILLFAMEGLTSNHLLLVKERVEGKSCAKSIDAFIDFHLGLGTDANPHSLAAWIVFSSEALRDAHVRKAYRKAMLDLAKVLEEIIDRGKKSKEFSKVDSSACAAAILATIQGYFTLAGSVREMIPKGTAAKSLKKMAQGLLA